MGCFRVFLYEASLGGFKWSFMVVLQAHLIQGALRGGLGHFMRSLVTVGRTASRRKVPMLGRSSVRSVRLLHDANHQVTHYRLLRTAAGLHMCRVGPSSARQCGSVLVVRGGVRWWLGREHVR